MCGISGAISVDPHRDLEGLVRAIVADQHARGPDAQAVKSYDGPGFRLTLGHNRLKIIDLSDGANHPMASPDEQLEIVYNGEIYNYVELRAELEAEGVAFATRSDTEVLLAAYARWGVDAFPRTIGMFGVAIYDRRDHSLLLARDRFGVKPLYYHANGRQMAFASTPQVIAREFGLAPSLAYVARGIALKYYEDESDVSPFEGIAALEPGHTLRVRVVSGRVVTEKARYYDLGAGVAACRERIAGLSSRQLEDELHALLASACEFRLRSDVPVGLSVSGGVDSSVIAALTMPRKSDLVGYSFGHPDAGDSEGPLVAELADKTGMAVRYVWPESPAAIEELFWKTLRAQGAPFPHVTLLAQYAVFEASRADGITVMLGGQGGDEAFMGYRKFYMFYLQSILRERRFSRLPGLVGAIVPLLPPVLKRANVFWSERRRYSGDAAGMGARLVLPVARDAATPNLHAGQSLAERQALDVTRFSLPTLLRYEDRNSMGNSIESRLPFMDQRVIEFGIALEAGEKLANGFGKHILRRVAKGLIPESIRVNRDKRGFDVRQDLWIRNGLGKVLRSALEARRADVQPFLRPGDSIADAFSDARLSTDPQAFKEAVSMIWLARSGMPLQQAA